MISCHEYVKSISSKREKIKNERRTNKEQKFLLNVEIWRFAFALKILFGAQECTWRTKQYWAGLNKSLLWCRNGCFEEREEKHIESPSNQSSSNQCSLLICLCIPWNHISKLKTSRAPLQFFEQSTFIHSKYPKIQKKCKGFLSQIPICRCDFSKFCNFFEFDRGFSSFSIFKISFIYTRVTKFEEQKKKGSQLRKIA